MPETGAWRRRIQKIIEGNGTTADAEAVPGAIRACMQSLQAPSIMPSSNAASSSSAEPDTSPAQIPKEYYSSFASAPNCSYVGPLDSQAYEYCKQCFPDK